MGAQHRRSRGLETFSIFMVKEQFSSLAQEVSQGPGPHEATISASLLTSWL